MNDTRPGFNPHRLITLIQQSIHRCELQLDNLTVLTEAATGAYVVTPVIAAMAGAKKVFAITQSSRYGTIEEVKAQKAIPVHLQPSYADLAYKIGDFPHSELAAKEVLSLPMYAELTTGLQTQVAMGVISSI